MESNTKESLGVTQNEVGPRIVVLKRSPEYGFGFTLRHFIVYPPEPSELSSELEGALFKRGHQPLDTIFVKQVRAGSPAYLANLRTGDRIIHVNECSVADHTYQDIVAVIQKESSSLRLVVVAKQHDILQQIFSSTAHNPESNLKKSSILSSYDPPSFLPEIGPNCIGIPPVSASLTDMPAIPAHRVPATVPSRTSNASHYASIIPTPVHPKRKESRKHSLPTVVDRKQAIYAIPEGSPTPSPRSSTRRRPRKEGIYEPVMVRSEIRGGGDEPKRLERDPDGRLYEVVQTRMLPSNIDVIPKAMTYPTEKSFSSHAHPSKPSSDSERPQNDHLVSSKSPSSSDRSTQEAIARIKRNIERKEQFLMGSNDSFPPKGALVYRQYQVSPQRLMPRPTWPPNSTQSVEALNAPDEKVLRRVQSNIDGPSGHQPEDPRSSSLPSSPVSKEETHFFPPGSPYAHIKPLVSNTVAKPYGSHDETYGKTVKPFVATLSRIQENIPSPNVSQPSGYTCASTTSLPTSTITQSDTPFGSNTSLTGSQRMVPLAWVGDNDRIKQLQIVSTRAKKFEAMKENEPARKSALQRFELSRLSQKAKAVSKRKEQFEKKQKSEDVASLNDSELDLAVSSEISSSGNRTNPVGGPKIHCVPPLDHMGQPINENHRDRSHSTCSHTLLWRDRDSAKKSGSLSRQHSFHSTLRSHFARAVDSLRSSAGAINDPSPQDTPDKINNKHLLGGDHERLVRRVSYLKATSDTNLSDTDHESDDDRTCKPIRRFARDLPSPASFKSSIVLHGQLHVKLTKLNGKKSGDRSWKTVWAVIRGRALLFYKDKQLALLTPLAPDDQVSLRGSEIAVASDYTKKRNVLRLTSTVGSQFLLQAESEAAMTAWLSSITSSTAQSTDEVSHGVPGTPTPTSSAPDLTVSPYTPLVSPDQAMTEGIHSDGELINKNIKKVMSPRRTRSPSNQWTIPRARKSTTGDLEPSPKSKTWKGRLGKHLRKMQVTAALSPSSSSLPHGASIGACLQDCPPSVENEAVPLIVALCIGVIESKGSNMQGIYRVPGNKAAVTHLIEMVNQGPSAIDLFDPRWSDTNVIASLLKTFLQRLPDPLIPSHLYSNFIEASKVEDQIQRLLQLKHLVHELPECHYETLQFLLKHFQNIVANCEHNKMDIKNLAIVFGPTLIRPLGDDVARLVNDMSHQCRIVETLISHGSWFFSDSETPPVMPDPASPRDQPAVADMETSSQSLLLDNVNKIEGNNYKDSKKFVSSLISAANRIHKNRGKKPDESMVEPDLPDPIPMSKRRISNISMGKLSTSSRDGQYFPAEMVLPAPDEPSYLGDEVAIRSYTGLSARTQERIRKFEVETRAMMLQRDILSRQESQKLESGRREVEQKLQKAKQDLETEDIFDRMARNPSEIVPRMSDYLSESLDRGPTREGGFAHPNASPGPVATPFASSLTQPCAQTPTNSRKEDKFSGSHAPEATTNHHTEGSDLLRDITATFEEKMRSLQESPFLTPDDPQLPPMTTIHYAPRDTSPVGKENTVGVPTCKLYRDPSLHRRRSNHAAKGLLEAAGIPFSPQNYTLPGPDACKPDKEKSEKRSRELQRTDGHESFREKRPKQSLRSKTQEIKLTLRDLEQIDSLISSEAVNRKQNVKELKEKFELFGNPVGPSDRRTPTGKQSRKAKIKRRHTVGGIKDLARVAWMRVIEAANQQKPHGVPVPSWEQIQLFIENVNQNRKDEPFVAREQLSAQSDVEALLALLVQPKRAATHKPLHPVLESNV